MEVRKKVSKELIPLYEAILETLSSPSRDIISAKKLSQRMQVPLEHMEHHLLVLAQKGQLLIGQDNEMIWVRKNK